MSNTSVPKRMFLFFPIMVALFPVLHLYDVNVDQVTFAMVWPALAKATIGVSACWLIIWLIHREPRRAGLTASILAMMYYGYFAYSGWIIQTILVALATNWLIYFIYRSKSDFRAFAAFMNVASLVTVSLALISIGQQLLNPPSMEVADRPQVLTEEQKKLVGNTPNIYYFILDGYGGRQVLDEHYRLDNSQFLSFLEDQGFWVSESSRSNYLRTLLSLPSSLNLEYLDEFIEINELEETTDERPAIFMMRNSLVKAYLTNFGYDTVGISSGFTGWNMSGAESYIDQKRAGTNEFQSIVNSHTPVFHVARELAVMDPFAKHRELHNSTLETVPQIPAQYPDSPIFTFIHMMCPHPPFVFKEDGSPAQPSEPLFHLGDGDYLVGVSMDTMEYQVGYANQLLHLNTLMTKAITDLRAADPEAIIIIQGDHGPGSHYVSSDIMQNNMVERSSILNAIYLPGPGREDLYDTISPVNTFRVIFNNYFGDDQELLPDKTYFSELRKPYKMYQLNFGSPESQDSQ